MLATKDVLQNRGVTKQSKNKYNDGNNRLTEFTNV